MKRNYKDYLKDYIGQSDIACLILAGFKEDHGVFTENLRYNADGEYMAYIVDENTEIGSHYDLIAKFDSWVKIYDDTSLVHHFRADKIKIYRAGDFGCIIQLINPKDKNIIKLKP